MNLNPTVWRRRGGWPTTALVAAVLVVGVAAPASAYPLPGRTERLTQGTRQSWLSSISADGRIVAFQSYEPAVVAGDTNGASDIFVMDRRTRVTERVSVSSSGAQANHHSYQPSMTPDGRFIAFNSFASNLVPDDRNGHIDVFVHDRQTGMTERVSVATDGSEGHWTSGGSDGVTGTFFSGRPAISDDGRRVAFWSFAKELDPRDENYVRDAFVHDRATRTTELVSLSTDGQQGGTGEVISVEISGDGNVVAFTADFGRLVPGDTNGRFDVFVRDLRTGVTERASVGTDGQQSDDISWSPNLNRDGRFVAFTSGSTNLVPDDFNGGGGPHDAFVRDRMTGRTERLSVSSDGVEANDSSYHPQLSPDGRFVVFGSYATNLVPGDANRTGDLFLHDRLTNAVQRIGLNTGEVEFAGVAGNPSFSTGGSAISFEVYQLETKTWDIFTREIGPALGVGALNADPAGGAVAVSGFARFSGVHLASGTDAAGDGRLQDQDIGGDLVGAAVSYRPDLGDLAVRLDVSRLVRPGTAGHRGVVYGIGFSVAGVPYEARANRLGGTAPTPTVENGYELYRCDATPCTHVRSLVGGIGTGGDRVVMTIPLSALGPQARPMSVRAFTAIGELATGAIQELDAIALGDAPPLPEASVQIGVAPVGAPEPDLVHAPLTDGYFSGSITPAGPGPHELWARACLGGECTTARRPMEEE